MTRYRRSLTPIIFYDIVGLSHLSYHNKTKRTDKKELDIKKNDLLRHVSLIGKKNITNTRLKRANHPKTYLIGPFSTGPFLTPAPLTPALIPPVLKMRLMPIRVGVKMATNFLKPGVKRAAFFGRSM